MKNESNASGMEKIATFIVDKRNFFIALFLAAAIFCAFSRNWVRVTISCQFRTQYNTELKRMEEILFRI